MSEDKRWQKCREVRPPNEPGYIRVRISTEILGLHMTPEWTTKMDLHGMGLREDEWWPEGINDWDGWKRSFMSDYEWRPCTEGDADGITWHGFDLLPCPFTGKAPEVEYSGRWITAPPDYPKWIGIKSHLIKSLGWRDAAALRDAWNTRAALSVESVDG